VIGLGGVRRCLLGGFDQALEVSEGGGADDAADDFAARGDHEGAGEGADRDQPVELDGDEVAWVGQARVADPVVPQVGRGAG